MSLITLGNGVINDISLGNANVTEIWLGNVLIWPIENSFLLDEHSRILCGNIAGKEHRFQIDRSSDQ